MEASRPAPKPRARAAVPPAVHDEPTVAPGPNSTPDAAADGEAVRATSFLQRAPLRRRLRYLGRRRELALRELGDLVFDAQREGKEQPELVSGKLQELEQIDGERERLEHALGERQELLVLRAPGITVCKDCSSLHGSTDRFCPHCGAATTRR